MSRSPHATAKVPDDYPLKRNDGQRPFTKAVGLPRQGQWTLAVTDPPSGPYGGLGRPGTPGSCADLCFRVRDFSLPAYSLLVLLVKPKGSSANSNAEGVLVWS